jgi:hypothetical protein
MRYLDGPTLVAFFTWRREPKEVLYKRVLLRKTALMMRVQSRSVGRFRKGLDRSTTWPRSDSRMNI